jgi:hypothetical protein
MQQLHLFCRFLQLKSQGNSGHKSDSNNAVNMRAIKFSLLRGLISDLT